ncbi:HI_0552 family protein [Enterococcus pseudoavium]|uniref:HI_0552 family protein n=1 Tax=Enterococcus pseudoavium TaxID=44007 RepID=A0ABU3FGG4_9ENTE|nr:HI_0552 family protein [Enterococcus pseudoavium]MDT2754083.1 HI_0552 family protein [Enterococcus pseudoavium]MDT2770135.1 HI_0552 family protein [Enterococcus pseudoavium]
MDLTIEDFQVLDREIYTFKQLKERYSADEIDQVKQDYKKHWQKWKKLQQIVAQSLPSDYHLEKPKIESWTNGWHLRNHFWSAYRDPQHRNQNACLAVLLNKKQFQVYLMFQHYKSAERNGGSEAYNKLVNLLYEWSQHVDSSDYYIWPQVEHELVDHLSLTDFLADQKQPEVLLNTLEGRTFQIGKLFFKTTKITDIEELTRQSLEELAPLYFALNQ